MLAIATVVASDTSALTVFTIRCFAMLKLTAFAITRVASAFPAFAMARHSAIAPSG